MREGKVGVNTGLVEEGKIPFRREGEVGVRDTQFPGVKNPEGV